MKRFAVLALLMGLVALPLLAQNPTGTLSGRVTDGKESLPGVTVTVTSPSLQGSRVAVTSADGDYIFKFLPPGEYRVKFELSGFQTQETSTKISAAVSSKIDAVLPMAQVAEEVTVTGSYETISSTSQASTTYEKSLVDKLPLGRDINNYVSMAPGVTAGVNGAQISGAQSYENLYLVNGVVVNENIRGQATNVFIEDAIQETTTSTASVSAEYGRFAGGVVNTITKSGGNEVSGSFRTTANNPTWTEETKYGNARTNKTTYIYEATLGGFFIKDRLWYFGAGRLFDQKFDGQTAITNIPFARGSKDTRYEVKATAAITPNHRVVGSYIKRDQDDSGYYFTPIPVMDLASVYDRQVPNHLFAYNYNGVITDNFFVEAQYSKRRITWYNSGGTDMTIPGGTVVFDNGQYGYSYNAPIFCGICGEERRDNNDYLAKGSWFLSTANLGSHDLVFGYDQFTDIRKANNYQSGSNFNLYSDDTLVGPANQLYPVILPESSSYWEYYPILNLSKGTDFKTKSIFINDKWRLNNNFSFNIGLRYDKNDGKNADHNKVADDSKISPRLAVTYDPTGEGSWIFNAGYAKYVMSIANGVGDSTSSGGQPAWFLYEYSGEPINDTCNPATGAGCLQSPAVIQKVYAWWQGLGGWKDDNPSLVGVDIPGGSTQIRKSLVSPSADEFTLGLSKRLGNNAMVRVDYVHRDFSDFYTTRVDSTTGQIETPNGLFDLKLVENHDKGLERTYDSLQTQFTWRVTDRLSAGGSYTWSKLYGNVIGETTGSGAVSLGVFEYPEFKAFKQYNPKGLLASDATHRARLYAVYDVLNGKHNRLSVSLMQNFFSGTPYGAAAAIRIQPYVSQAVMNQYLTPPSTVNYWFTARDKWRTPNITRTDISITYAFAFNAVGKEIQLFITPAVTNVFNEQELQTFNTTVYTSNNAGRGLTAFNPFTTKPVECTQKNASGTVCTQAGANWMKGPLWGKPTLPAHYQTPRSFTVSAGFRF
ncbi:MAG: TonB-dependent receptor [Thermoanaerobaculaceae bacterium]|nr:TonB-dependent receptor [Thermoanaerobaculaceae bacterium]MDI9622401.1 TonB-dependent receptor [Acidobacteriota bacterium]NLH11156.1 TonB-dependent receptor [Holophagae bacterium]HPW54302.1 TonB-dependent receptor [Thermoanaerobaculaceae bacterium]